MSQPPDISSEKTEPFITRWQGQAGGQERANYALFLTELCDALGLPHPDPADARHERNDYVFERLVTHHRDDGDGIGRIDLYRKNSFVLEAKQSRWKGGTKEIAGQSDLFAADTGPQDRGKRGAGGHVAFLHIPVYNGADSVRSARDGYNRGSNRESVWDSDDAWRRLARPCQREEVRNDSR